MTLAEIIQNAYLPAIGLLDIKDSPEARVIMLAIGQQESRFKFRRQMNDGPAVGYWQFEKGGGIRGVLNHISSARSAAMLCAARQVQPNPAAVWVALQVDDVLAAGFARLLLYTDPRPLPDVTDAQGAWDCYERNWRPGKPHRDTWDAFHVAARAEVGI